MHISALLHSFCQKQQENMNQVLYQFVTSTTKALTCSLSALEDIEGEIGCICACDEVRQYEWLTAGSSHRSLLFFPIV